MEYIITNVLGGFGRFLASNDFFILLIGVYIVSTFVYWLASKYIDKLRNDIFDSWFFITAITIIWGRLSYVIANWHSFISSYWFYLPYEKYPNVEQIFWFRTMPWKLVTIWDGGFLYSAMFAAFLLSALIFIIRLKRWPIREMLAPISMSIATMMGGIFFMYGMFLGGDFVSEQAVFLPIASTGFLMLSSVIVMLIVNWIVSLKIGIMTSKQRNLKDIFNGMYFIGISYSTVMVFFDQSISTIDQVNVYGYLLLLLLTIFVAILGVNEDSPEAPGRNQLRYKRAPVRNKAIKSDLL